MGGGGRDCGAGGWAGALTGCRCSGSLAPPPAPPPPPPPPPPPREPVGGGPARVGCGEWTGDVCGGRSSGEGVCARGEKGGYSGGKFTLEAGVYGGGTASRCDLVTHTHTRTHAHTHTTSSCSIRPAWPAGLRGRGARARANANKYVSAWLGRGVGGGGGGRIPPAPQARCAGHQTHGQTPTGDAARTAKRGVARERTAHFSYFWAAYWEPCEASCSFWLLRR